jgi:hypothetical protein
MRLIIDNSNVCSLYNLRNTESGETVIDATVELTIYDSDGTPVGGGIWPQAMRHISNGHYRVTLEDTLTLLAGRSYRGVVTAVASQGNKGQWELQLLAEPQKVY